MLALVLGLAGGAAAQQQVLLGRPAGSQLSSAGTPAPPPAAGLAARKVSAEWQNLTLPQAAAKLSELLGTTVSIPEPPQNRPLPIDSQAPVLDLKRTASFSWKEVSAPDALREFCRKFGCSLVRDYRGELVLSPVPLAAGPVARLEGYEIELGRILFSDYRATGDDIEDLSLRRTLSLQFALRAVAGDLVLLQGLENLRVLDQDGHDVLEPATPAATPYGRISPSAFPDERLQSVSFEWPYPTPHRLRLVEGELVLHVNARRTPVEVQLPKEGSQAPVPFGDGQLQFTQLRSQGESFSAMAYVTQPPNVDFQGAAGSLVLLLEDGTRVPASLTGNSPGLSDGWVTGYMGINAAGLKSRPVKLLWTLVVRSEATRRFRFRFTDFPGQLGPPLPAKPPVRPPVRKDARPAVRTGGQR